MKIARHFSGGYAYNNNRVPEGRLNLENFQASLRDALLLTLTRR
jgi:hypothetical protein